MPGQDKTAAAELVHPIYLDVPMLISFLAALEGGVSLEDHATSRSGTTSGREREGKARIGLPSLVTLLNLDMSGRLSAKSETQSDSEVSAVRRHTEASLFNRLRARLIEVDAVTFVHSSEVVNSLEPGALVEVSGEVTGNPILQMSQVILAAAPFAGVDVETLLQGKYDKTPRPRAKTGVPQHPEPPITPESAAGLKMFLMMGGQLMNSPVRDVVLTSESELSTVMTLATSFVEEVADAYVYESEVRVLGKLTRIVRSGDEPINLTRRSSLGMLPRNDIAEMIKSTQDGLNEGLNVQISDAFVEGPAIQVLPLAIFV